MRLLVTVLALGFMSQTFAQTAITAPEHQAVPAVEKSIEPPASLNTAANVGPSVIVIPAKMPIQFTLDSAISSKTAQPGGLFQLKVADDLVINNVLVIPAGTPAFGEVIHAQKSGGFGKAGELLLAIRYIDLNGQQIKMRTFKPLQGKDDTRTASNLALVPVVGLFVPFIRGGEIELPVNTLVQALVTSETTVTQKESIVPEKQPLPQTTAAPTTGDSP